MRRPSLVESRIMRKQAQDPGDERGTTPNLPPNLPNEKSESLPLETVKLARCDTREPTCRQREDKLTRPRERVSKRRTRAARLPRRGLPPPFGRAVRGTRGDWSARGAPVYARSPEHKRRLSVSASLSQLWEALP